MIDRRQSLTNVSHNPLRSPEGAFQGGTGAQRVLIQIKWKGAEALARVSKQPEERRQELIDAARALFQTQGYEHTAVSDIVHRVGVAQGLFYYYYHSKQEIFLAVIDQFIQRHISELATELQDATLPPLSRIHNLMQMLTRFFRELEGLYRPGQVTGEMFAVIQNHVCEVMEPIITALLREGTELGILDAPYPERMARFFIAGFIGVESMPDAPQADEMMELIRLTGSRLLRVPGKVLEQRAPQS